MGDFAKCGLILTPEERQQVKDNPDKLVEMMSDVETAKKIVAEQIASRQGETVQDVIANQQKKVNNTGDFGLTAEEWAEHGRGRIAATAIKRIQEKVGKDWNGKDWNEQDIVQLVGTAYANKNLLADKMTRGDAALLAEYKFLQYEKYTKKTAEQLMALPEQQRLNEIMKAEFLREFDNKINAVNNRVRSQELLIARRADIEEQMKSVPDRNAIETYIDLLAGEARGLGTVQPLLTKMAGVRHEYDAKVYDAIGVFEHWFDGYNINKDQELKLVKAMRGEVIDDAEIKAAAQKLTNVYNSIVDRMNAGGANIAKMDHYTAQSWSPRKIRTYGLTKAELAAAIKDGGKKAVKLAKERWIEGRLKRLDWTHPDYVDRETGSYYGEKRKREFLSEAFDTLASSGQNKAEQAGQGSFATRLEVRRKLHYKSAEDYLADMREFGEQDFISTTVRDIHRMASDLAILEHFGPHADQVNDALYKQAVASDARTGGFFYNRKANFAKALWMEIAANRATAGTGMFADFMAGARQGMAGANLGSALLSQLGDLPIFHALAVKSGTGAMQALFSVVKELNPLNAKHKRAASELGFAVSVFNDDIVGRISDTTNGNGATAKMARFTMKVGGMQYWADAMDRAAKALLTKSLYNRRNTAMEQLPAGDKALLKRHGIKAAEWDAIRNNPEHFADMDGATILAPDLIKDRALREKVWGMLDREATFMALRPDEKTRAFIKGTHDRGSLAGEMQTSLFVFRSFTAALFQKAMPRLFATLPGESRSQYMKVAIGFAFASMIANGLSVQLKEIAKGREPREMDVRFWMAAFFNGANLSILGDFAYGEKNRMGHSLTETIAGPMAGAISTMADYTLGNAQKARAGQPTHMAAETINIAKKFLVPNLWQTRLLLDHYLWYPAMEWANPGYQQRIQQRAERENDTKFWMGPTDAHRY